MLYINDTSYFVPNYVRDIDDVGEIIGIDKNHLKVYKKIFGIEKIPTAIEMRFHDFIKKPIEQLFKNNQINKDDIHYLIHCHTAKVISPFFTSIIRDVKKDLALTNANAFGISVNNCASVMTAFDILNHVLENKNSKAIIVAGDYTFTPVMQYIPNTSILAEASSAALIGLHGDKNKLIAISTRIEGQFAKGIWLSPLEANEFEACYVNLLSDIILNAVNKAKLTKDQIKLIIPHNVNLPSWKRVANSLNIPIEKIYLDNVKKYSHCFGADMFINLASIEKEKIIQPGDYYVMATVGLGAVFSAAVFQY